MLSHNRQTFKSKMSGFFLRSFKHPKDKACYQKICFNNSFSEGIEVALFDRESTNIRYLCCGSRICSADGEVGNFDDITLNGVSCAAERY